MVILLCLLSVIGGKLYWNHRLNQVRASSAIQSQDELSGLNAESSDSSDSLVMKKIKKLPSGLQKAAINAYKKNGQVQISLIGSENTQGLAMLLQQQFDKVYGASFFKVTVQDLSKSNSLALNQAKIQDLMKNVNGQPDAIIFTPLLYNDDRNVSTEDTETVTSLLEEKAKIKYPKAAFFVSLPNYSSNQSYMNRRIDQLKTYIQKQKIDEINYLSKWPKGAKRVDVVGSDGHTMNKSGQKIWIDYVSDKWGLK
nr:hypothetical protein [Sporolactobacillus kofuensis]